LPSQTTPTFTNKNKASTRLLSFNPTGPFPQVWWQDRKYYNRFYTPQDPLESSRVLETRWPNQFLVFCAGMEPLPKRATFQEVEPEGFGVEWENDNALDDFSL
jgi:hypothetical protein